LVSRGMRMSFGIFYSLSKPTVKNLQII
jgi:hypothetical protein